MAVAMALTACTTDGDDPVATSASPATWSPAASSTAAIDTTDPFDTTDTTDAIDATDATDTTDATDGLDDARAATRAIFAPVAVDDPGCTVAVGLDGDVVYAEAFGAARLDPTTPMEVGTRVDIGSTSKQFTATAIVLLAERGEVSLDDPLGTHVGGLPPWSDRTTLRQLVHHTSGIPDYIGLLIDEGFDLTGSSTDADALAALAAVTELEFEPGTEWAYSNSNYFLLGQVVLGVTGSTLAEFLSAEVFEPLGLDMVMDPVTPFPDKAISYEGTGAAQVVADSRWEQLGDGGIQTTPSELVRWAAEYWSPTVGGDGITAARLDDAAAMTGPDGEPFGRYGAGIQVIDVPGVGRVLTHSGGWGGFVTIFVVVPEQRLAIAGTCTSPDTMASLAIGSELDLLEPWLERG